MKYLRKYNKRVDWSNRAAIFVVDRKKQMNKTTTMNNRFFTKQSTDGQVTITPNFGTPTEESLPPWESQIPQRGRVGMPRESTDHRVRNWSTEEKLFVYKWHAKGKSMRSIRLAIGCSYAPLKRFMTQEGLIK